MAINVFFFYDFFCYLFDRFFTTTISGALSNPISLLRAGNASVQRKPLTTAFDSLSSDKTLAVIQGFFQRLKDFCFVRAKSCEGQGLWLGAQTLEGRDPDLHRVGGILSTSQAD